MNRIKMICQNEIANVFFFSTICVCVCVRSIYSWYCCDIILCDVVHAFFLFSNWVFACFSTILFCVYHRQYLHLFILLWLYFLPINDPRYKATLYLIVEPKISHTNQILPRQSAVLFSFSQLDWFTIYHRIKMRWSQVNISKEGKKAKKTHTQNDEHWETLFLLSYASFSHSPSLCENFVYFIHAQNSYAALRLLPFVEHSLKTQSWSFLHHWRVDGGDVMKFQRFGHLR